MKNKKILYIIFIGICMLTIFTFSSRNSNESNSTSKGLINNIINTYEKITNKNIDNEKVIKTLNYPVRKVAHYSIYFILGIFVYKLILLTSINKKKLVAILICFTYASLDEIHQLFVIGRTGQLKDVLIDTIGALTPILIMNHLKKKRLRTCNFNKNVL